MRVAATLCILAMSSAQMACTRDRGQDAPTDSPMNREKSAQSAAEAWLVLVDAGNYSQSWTEAAAYFKNAIDQPGWEKALTGVRAPLGNMQSRALRGAKYATSLPGAP